MPLPLLQHAAVGRPITRADVSLFPVYLPGAAGPLELGPAADVAITERPDATVSVLVATNTGDLPVLLLEGETVAGGQQHRTLNVSVLLAAHSEVDLPVSCIEAGRWSGGSAFGRGRTFATRRVRRVKAATVADSVRRTGSRATDQHQVWSAIDHELDRLGAFTASRALLAADDALEQDTRLGDAVEDLLSTGPLAGQRGVVVAHGSRIVAAEVFAGPEQLGQHWEALVRSCLLDAPERVTGRPSATRALRFLHRLATAPAAEVPAVGVGCEHHVRTTGIVGQALSLDGRLLHASGFALAA